MAGTLKRTVLNGFATSLHRTAMPVLRAVFGGRGAILVFHEINTDPAEHLYTGCSAAFLDAALAWLKRSGWEFVGLDEGLRRAEDPHHAKRFIVLTFDDGYRDTLTRALPILARYAAPFTVYVPTGAVTRTLDAWWLALRELIRSRESVTIDAMGETIDCRDLAGKAKALSRIATWVHRDLRRSCELAAPFQEAGISMPALIKRYFLDEKELQGLANHPLASIQAHTTNHPALIFLDEDLVRREMSDNRAWLENLVQAPVDHFAYPFGHERACGPREADIAAGLGFTSAVTTRSGPVAESDIANRYLLPRVWVGATTNIARLDASVSGVEHMVRKAAGGIGFGANA